MVLPIFTLDAMLWETACTGGLIDRKVNATFALSVFFLKNLKGKESGSCCNYDIGISMGAKM